MSLFHGMSEVEGSWDGSSMRYTASAWVSGYWRARQNSSASCRAVLEEQAYTLAGRGCRQDRSRAGLQQ